MRIVIVGGRGFIGSHLNAWLRAAGHKTVVLGPGDPLVGGDVVVHLALFGEADARIAVEQLRGCTGRLVIASSGDVYRAYGCLRGSEPGPPPPRGLLNERAPLRTVLYPYGREATLPSGRRVVYEKILVERVVLGEKEVPAVVLRLPKVFGPGDRQRTFDAYVRRIVRDEPIRLDPAAAAWRWTHGYVEDVAVALALAVTSAEVPSRVYNVGEAEAVTLRERIERLARSIGAPVRIEVVPRRNVPPDLVLPLACPVDLVFDTRRIRDELGWQEQVGDHVGLARTAHWLLDSPSAAAP